MGRFGICGRRGLSRGASRMVDWFHGRYVRPITLTSFTCKRDVSKRRGEITFTKGPLRCKFIADVGPPSSEIADACARDINHLFCNVASASIRGINCLSLSCIEPGEKVRRISSIASAITCPDHGTGGQKACLHLVISSSPAHASCSTRGVSPSFDPHLP